ncbi:MAG: helix-turn-helix domain-containing protein [Patescibacteria group bacterium]
MKEYYSAQEAADLLGISKVALINQIRAGKITAQRVGHAYIIAHDDLPFVSEKGVSKGQKKEIEEAVKKTIAEYGETLRLLKDA